MFLFFTFDNIDNDSATTVAHTKTTIKEHFDVEFLIPQFSKIWGNTYGCGENYRCDTAVFIIYCLAHSYTVIIECNISAPGHKKMLSMVSMLIQKYLLFIQRTKSNCMRYRGTNTEFLLIIKRLAVM